MANEDQVFAESEIERRLAEVERKTNALYSAGLELLVQSGYLQFDNIPQRLDSSGRQVLVGTSTANRYFYEFLVSKFVPNPTDGVFPLLAAGGYVGATEIQHDFSAYLTANNYARTFEYADNTPEQRAGAEAARGATIARGFANIGSADDGHFKIEPAALFEAVADRPTGLAAGGVWFGTDNKLYLYDGTEDVDLGVQGGGMSLIVKEADTTINSDATVNNDAELLFPVAANEVWQFEGVLNIVSPAAGDFQMAVTGPAGAVGSVSAIYDTATIGQTASNSAALGSAMTLATTGVGKIVRFWGGIHNGGTAGNLQLQWAQGTSDVGNTTVFAGSYLKYQLES